MIHTYNDLANAYSSNLKGVVGINSDGTAYIETDDRPIAEIRAEKKSHVEALRDSLYEQGVQVGDFWFQTSLWSKISFLGIAAMGKDYPGWKTMSGEAVTITATLAGQIMAAIGVQTALIHANCEAHKTSIDKATDLYNYNISTGWPEVFIRNLN